MILEWNEIDKEKRMTRKREKMNGKQSMEIIIQKWDTF